MASTMGAGANRFDQPTTPITQLVPFLGAGSPVQLLQETLEYATSPKNYLVRRLGEEVFKQRSHLFSLPETLIDRDTYGTGVHKQHFEQHIATLLGKKHGLFFITGIQAQLTTVKIHCDRAGNNRVAWHYRCHLEIAEERAFAEVFHLQRTFIGKSQLQVPTVEDVKAITSLPVDERPAVVLLELPNRELGCKTYPFEDLVQISKLCKAANVKLHLDGARLWEIEPFYQGKSFADIAALFDSVYVSLYKGLGGAVGAMLTSSDEDFMDRAKTWQRRLGGNLVAFYPALIDDERGFNLNIGTFYLKWQKMCSVASAIMEATKKYRTKDGKPIVFFEPEVPTCAQIHTHIQGVTVERLTAAKNEVEKTHRISVFRSTRPWQALDEMDADWALVKGVENPQEKGTAARKEKSKEDSDNDHHFFEWMIRNENLGIADEVYAKGWEALCQLITAGQ
ncbi:Pyridoxal phosphate-dependent transferase [Hyaloscypha variabilis]